MKCAACLLLLLAAAACGSLPTSGDGIVSLQVLLPASLTLPIGKPVTLHAVALDLQGDSVLTTPIYWRTPDTALVTLDTALGVVTARVSTGTARVQARVGTLLSDVISFALTADTSGTSVRARP